jgi:hypothetical protein
MIGRGVQAGPEQSGCKTGSGWVSGRYFIIATRNTG